MKMTDTTIWVLAAPGRVVPFGGGTRKRFSAETPRRVAPTTYIRRRLRDGDLVEVKPPKPAGGETTKPAKETR